MPAVRDPLRRPPVAAAVAAVLALPATIMVLVFGNAALSLSATRGGGAATWIVLLLTFGWVVALLVGAGRLLTGRSWIGLAVSAALLALLGVLNAASGGLGGGNAGLILTALFSGGGAAVGASLPGVRAWVNRRRRERLFPGSTQRTPSGS